MNGARQYAELFKTGQFGRLYIVSGSHARGKTFHIYVLPKGVEAQSNGPNNAPLNVDAVEVYGITGGQPGWTETYGWLHAGKWQQDFLEVVANRQAELAGRSRLIEKQKAEFEADRKAKVAALLATY